MSVLILLLAVLSVSSGLMTPAAAQTNSGAHPFSFYIPTAVPTATVTLFSNGSTGISPGRVAVDKAGNVFYIAHVSGSASTLYEIPATGVAVTTTSPTPLVSGLGQSNANSAFVDAAGSLWVSNGNGTGGALLQIPAANGIPGTAAITGNGKYVSSTGLPLTNITSACTSAPTAPCVWSASSIVSTLSSLQIGDIYSDGAGNVYLVDVSDSISEGAYNRVLQFSTASTSSSATLADRLTSNSYAQLTVAGDGNLYYCDSVTGNAKGGLVSLISADTLTTVGNTANANLTLLNAIVKVPAATGVTTDPWGNLIISGPAQLSEVPMEAGALAWVDQFNLLVAISGGNAPMYNNNVVYGGAFDVHGSYYYASATNIMQTQVNGYNFGQVSVGTEVTSSAPYLNITWDVPSYLETSLVATASPSTLSAANAAYLQSFPYGNAKNYFGGTPYAASNTGQYSLMYFQPVHAGLVTGAISPQGFSDALEATDTNYSTDFYQYGAYLANLQGVGVGPQPMFLPGTASDAVTMSQLYTSYSHTTKAVGFTPTGVAVDSFGDIFVADTANTSLDLDCLSTTANTAQNYRSGAAGNGYANSYCLTNGLDATNGSNLAGYTFVVNATGSTGTSFATSFVNPVDVVVDGANNAYVLDSSTGTATVTRMPFAAMIPSVVIPSGATVGGTAFNSPQGLAIDGYGNLYIADTYNDRIVQARLYNATYSQNIVYVSSSTTFGGTPLNRPTGMGLDAAGDLFIADTGNKRIVEYSVTGVASVVGTTGVTLANPTNVKVLPSGALIVADSTLGLVMVQGGSGTLLTTSGITLYSTQGLALDQAGNAYVADPSGAQVVKLNFSAPATATSFPQTQLTKTSTESSFIYNDGNSPLIFSAAPTTVDNSTAASDEFSVDAANTCTTNATLAANSYCSLIMDFTPLSTAIAYVYSVVPGTATVADNLQPFTLITNPVSGGEDIGSFGSSGSSQAVYLNGYPTVPMTAQTINFTPPAAVTWSASIPTIQLVATGGASGNPVVFSIVRGTGTLSGPNNSILTQTQIGSTVIAANQAGAEVSGTYYAPATQVTQVAVVNPIASVATPTFSLPGGTYTAVQKITISDTTAGAVIHYTTNGNTPTASSPVYTAGTVINIPITTTVQAIAFLSTGGYAPSAVASATYTLNPDFVLKSYQTTFNIPSGLAGGTTISISPLFGFDAPVTFSCSGLPSGDTCTFVPSTITALTIANGAIGYTALTIQTAGTTATSGRPAHWPFSPNSPYTSAGTLAAALLLVGIRKRRRLFMVVLLVLSAAGAGMLSGCNATPTLQKNTFTMTATSGGVTHTATFTLIVNNF
jgi:sugar lactone lactonase YvrE